MVKSSNFVISYNIFFFTMLASLHTDLQATDNELCRANSCY